MAQNELRKASIVDSNFQEIALRAQKKFKLAYLETTLLLYKRLNNNYSIELIEEEIKKANESDDLLVKEKKPSINKQIQKKLDIINQFENNDNSDVKNTSSITSDIQNNISKTKVEKNKFTPKYELKSRIDVH